MKHIPKRQPFNLYYSQWSLIPFAITVLFMRIKTSSGQENTTGSCPCLKRSDGELCLQLVQEEPPMICVLQPCQPDWRCDESGTQCCVLEKFDRTNLLVTNVTEGASESGMMVDCSISHVSVTMTQRQNPIPYETYIRKFVPEDPYADDNFGNAVALSGNNALVAARYRSNQEFQQGVAYMFDVSTGAQLFKFELETPWPGALFGSSLALNDRFAVVASQSTNQNMIFNIYDVSSGTLLRQLKILDNLAYGWSTLSIQGDLLLIGIPLHNIIMNGTITSIGVAYMFNVSIGQQLYRLTASDKSANARFGWDVSLGGRYAFISATTGNTSVEAVYLFDINTREQLRKLTTPDGTGNDLFGFSLSLSPSGNFALVAAQWNDARKGSAYLYDTISWNVLFKFQAKDAELNDKFGFVVQVDEDVALITADGKDNNCKGFNTGAAYIFSVNTGKQLTKLAAQDGRAGDNFGWSGALDGNLVLVGGLWNDENGVDSGASYLFDISGLKLVSE